MSDLDDLLARARRTTGVRGPAPGGPSPRRLTEYRRIAADRQRNYYEGLAEGAQARAQVEAPQEAPKSLLGQFREIATGLPAGVVGMVGDIGQDLTGLVRVPVEMLTGDHRPDSGEVGDYFPFLNELGQSMRRTGERVVEGTASLAPGGLSPSDTRYGKAIREGSIVGAVIEDVGNAAIVGSAVSGGTTVAAGRAGAKAATLEATAASLADDAVKAGRVTTAVDAAGETVRIFPPDVLAAQAQAAEARAVADAAASRAGAVQRVARGTNMVADAPARVFTVPAKLGWRASAPLRERAANTATGQAVRAAVETRRSNRALVGDFAEDVLRPMQDLEVEAKRIHGFAGQEATKRVAPIAKDLGVTPEALQYADLFHTSGLGQFIVDVRRRAEALGDEVPDLAETLTRGIVGIERAIPDGALPLLEQMRDGTLDPAIVARLDQAQAPIREQLARMEEEKLAGTGRKTGPMNPEQLERAPMPTAIAYRMANLYDKIEGLERELKGNPEARDDFGLYGDAARARAEADRVRESVLERGGAPRAETQRLIRTTQREGRVEGLEQAAEVARRRASQVPEPGMPEPQLRLFGDYDAAVARQAAPGVRAETVGQVGADLTARGQARMRPVDPPDAQVAPLVARQVGDLDRARAATEAARQVGEQGRAGVRAGARMRAVEEAWWRDDNQPVAAPAVDPDAPVTPEEATAARETLKGVMGPAGKARRAAANLTLPGDIDLPKVPREWVDRGGAAKTRWAPTPQDWDWLETLDNETLDAWRHEAGGWARPSDFPLDEHGRRVYGRNPDGSTIEGPDSWAQYLDSEGQVGGTSPEQAAAHVVDIVRQRNALRQIEQGRRPSFDVSGQFTPDEWAAIQALPEGRGKGTGARIPKASIEAVARARRGQAGEAAAVDVLGPEPAYGPWKDLSEQDHGVEMSALTEEWGRYVEEAQRELDAADPTDEWGGHGPAQRALDELNTRWQQLSPDEFAVLTPDGAYDFTATWRRLHEQDRKWAAYHETGDLDAARAAGNPQRMTDADAAAEAAVATAESRAFEAIADDLRRGEAAGRALRPGEREFDRLRREHPEAVPIYRQMEAEVRELGAGEALARAQQRAIDSLRNRPTARSVGGRAVAREGERLTQQGQRLTEGADAARVAGDQALAARRQIIGDRLAAAGERRGRLIGRRGEAEAIAGDIGQRASVLDREARPVVGEVASERALGQLEDRLRSKLDREGGRIGRAEQKARDLETLVKRREAALERARGRAAEREAGYAQGPVTVAPGMYRTVLLNVRKTQRLLNSLADERTRVAADELGIGVEELSRDMLELVDDPVAAALVAIADDLPDTMAKLHEGAIYPNYLPGGVDEPMGKGSSLPPSSGASMPRESITSAEQAKRLGRVPGMYRTVFRELALGETKVIQNKVVERMTAEGRWARPGTALLEELRPELGDGIVNDLLAGRTGDRALDIGKALERAGYTAWDPGSPWSSVHPERIGLDTLFVPTPIFKEYRRWFRPDPDHLVLKMLDYPTRAFKHAVLALNPYWHFGNILGNAMLATIAAGENPAILAREGWSALKTLTEEGSTPKAVGWIVERVARDLDLTKRGMPQFPGRLYDAGTSAEFMRLFSEAESRGPLARLLRSSYNFNNFVDNLGRSTVYNAKLRRGMTSDAAVKAALDSMGDFARMTWFERNVVRRTIPFYAWLRHVAHMSMTLPVNHPWRVAATLHLANLYRPEMPEGTPPWLMSALPLGVNENGEQRYLNLSVANPFLAGVTPLSLLSGEEGGIVGQLGRALNPVGQALLAVGWGFNARQGRPMTRPEGLGRADHAGREQMGPLGFMESLYYLSQQTPQTRLIANEVGPWSEDVLRYDTGWPIVAQGRMIERPSDSLVAMAGIPQSITQNLPEQRWRTLQKMRALQEMRRQYLATIGGARP